MGYYVLLSNLYATLSRRVDVANVRAMIKDRALKKEPRCSWIDVGNNMHAFLVGDISHARSDDIYATLKNLVVQMRAVGYVPCVSFVLHDTEDYNLL